MSSGPSTSATAKLASEKKSDVDPSAIAAPKPPPALLEEDDEFEDFPIEDWTQEDTEMPGGNTHLWEESWDDNEEENEEFSKQLKEELKKVEAGKT